MSRLLLNDHSIRELQEWYGNLVNLEDLDVGNNLLQRLQDSFLNLAQMGYQSLSVSGNLLTAAM